MRGIGGARSAVIYDRHPLSLDALGKLVAGLGVEVVGRSTDDDGAHRPDVFIAAIRRMRSKLLASGGRRKVIPS